MILDRRSFLQASALGLAALAAPRLAFSATPVGAGQGPDTLVVVFQRGGMDPLQAIPPWADDDYYRARPTIAVPRPDTGSGAAIPLDNLFGLHPSLAPLLPLYQAQRLGIVQATGLRHPDRSHFECQDHIELALMGLDGHAQGHGSGWLNRQIQLENPSQEFYAVGFGTRLQRALFGPAPAVAMAGIDSYAFTTGSPREAALEDALYQLNGAETALAASGRKALDSVEFLALANPGQYPVDNAALYPGSAFGAQLAQVAQLIKANLGLRLACVDIGGWDHHANIQTLLPPLLDELARGLGAFDTDLGSRMGNVTVVVLTEFGRRVAENASGGTDHGCGSAMLLLGGGVRGGHVYSDWPTLRADRLYNGDLDPTVDYRTVLAELLSLRMGVADTEAIFPDAPVQGPLGIFRPLLEPAAGCTCPVLT